MTSKKPQQNIDLKIDNLIRDITKAGFMPKSEAHRRIEELLKAKDKEFIEILDGLEMKTRTGMKDNIQYRLGYNLAVHLLNNKIKQIKQLKQ